MRTLSSELTDHIDKTVEVAGWLHKKRAMGGLMFVVIRDRHGLVQAAVESEAEQEKLRGLQVGTVVSIKGALAKEDRAPGGAELRDPEITIISAVTDEPPVELDKPLSHKSENLDTLFDNRPITLRNLNERAIFTLQAKVLAAFRTYFGEHDFTEMNSPKLLAEPTEGGAETFRLDYFGKTATLAQSAQFYKQMMVGVFERVYETNPTYRAEPSATTRHMTEYITIDAEMGFTTFDELLNFAAGALISVVDQVKKTAAAELAMWQVPEFVLPAKSSEVPRLTIDEIHEKFLAATKEDHTDEDDLAPGEERWICEYAKENLGSEAVLVVGWPSNSKTFKFYHRVNEDNPQLADRADLLFRGVEIATISMREHRYERLIKQLEGKGGDPTNPGLTPLLSAYKYGMPPHGGFGWGLERTVEKILNLNSIKEASLFPRDINRLTP